MKYIVFALMFLLGKVAVGEPMTFTLRGNGGNCGKCDWLEAKGEITTDTPDALRSYIGAQEVIYVDVMFDSPGGNLGAAIEVGRILREYQARTSVGRSKPLEGFPPHYERAEGGRCNSACVFAFLGGRSRSAEAGQLGVHQFHSPDKGNIPTAATQQIMGQLVLYLIEMGISPELLSIASGIPAARMHRLTVAELERLDIATKSGESPLRLEVTNGGLIARWDQFGNDGKVSVIAGIRCSTSHKAWLLDVRHVEIARLVTGGPASGSLEAREPVGMSMTIGEQSWEMENRRVTQLAREENDFVIEVALPVDLRNYANLPFHFAPYEFRAWLTVLNATGSLPDAATLDVLVRACGE